ncbi:MAG: hypothetical protein WEB79_04260 [Thermoleophilaceae bacterium]
MEKTDLIVLASCVSAVCGVLTAANDYGAGGYIVAGLAACFALGYLVGSRRVRIPPGA